MFTLTANSAFFSLSSSHKRNLYQLHAELHICGHMQRTEYWWDYMRKTDFLDDTHDWTFADTGHWIGGWYISQNWSKILSWMNFSIKKDIWEHVVSIFLDLNRELDRSPSNCRLVAGFLTSRVCVHFSNDFRCFTTHHRNLQWCNFPPVTILSPSAAWKSVRRRKIEKETIKILRFTHKKIHIRTLRHSLFCHIYSIDFTHKITHETERKKNWREK